MGAYPGINATNIQLMSFDQYGTLRHDIESTSHGLTYFILRICISLSCHSFFMFYLLYGLINFNPYILCSFLSILLLKMIHKSHTYTCTHARTHAHRAFLIQYAQILAHVYLIHKRKHQIILKNIWQTLKFLINIHDFLVS